MEAQLKFLKNSLFAPTLDENFNGKSMSNYTALLTEDQN